MEKYTVNIGSHKTRILPRDEHRERDGRASRTDRGRHVAVLSARATASRPGDPNPWVESSWANMRWDPGWLVADVRAALRTSAANAYYPIGSGPSDLRLVVGLRANRCCASAVRDALA